jgi:hypothetical protein
MKLKVLRYSIDIIPESIQDEAFIEEVLKLKNEGDEAQIKRINVMKLSGIAYLEIKAKGDKE